MGKSAARGAFKDSDRVVAISTAHGLKFGGVKAAITGKLPEGAAAPNQPVVLAANIQAVYDAVETHRAAVS